MTHEERLDRLERVMKLVVRAGLRARRQSREQDEKINILIDSQIKNEELFAALAQTQAGLAQTQDGLAQTQAALAQTQAGLAQTQDGLAQGHAETGDRLNALINIVERYIAGRNGGA